VPSKHEDLSSNRNTAKKRIRLEDHKFQASLGYVGRPYLKKQTNRKKKNFSVSKFIEHS
jgi:hypothetical protein